MANILGVKITEHDTGAALISNGRVLAIAEERLNRVKHSHNMFPELAISYCLREFGLKPEDINLVVMDQVDTEEKYPTKEIFFAKTGNAFRHARIEVINHHDAHAASAFFCSPFDEAAILIYDGAGEKFKSHLGVTATETDTLYYGQKNKLHQIQKTVHLRDGKTFLYTFGIGKLYSWASATYLNLGQYNEGKMMGLAPYGNDSVLKQFPLQFWYRERVGHILCNSKISYPKGKILKRLAKKNPRQLLKVAVTFLRSRTRSFLKNLYILLSSVLDLTEIYIDPKIFPKIKLLKPPRQKDQKLPDDYYASVAYAVQKVLEKIAVAFALKLKNVTRSKNLCVAGGAGLNIDANKKFFDEAGFENVFIQPASSDTGVALGCALYGWHMTLEKPRFWEMKTAYLGRKYSESEILSAIEKAKAEIIVKKDHTIVENTARLIAKGKIIGWFQGESEYGPRALGHRSILCDARLSGMKDMLNEKVKHREPWRPFACSILKEHLSEWFELDKESPFMLLAASVKEEKKQLIPSVVHVDGTTRIQSVTKEENGSYYDLISVFHKLTGAPLILNTSFNLAGEPIVETPDDALRCFLSTKMDYLVIGNYLISKR